MATSFTALPGFMPLYVKSKAAELFRMLFYVQRDLLECIYVKLEGLSWAFRSWGRLS